MLKALKPHQVRARKFVLDHGRCAGLFMDPGTGKTLVAIRCCEKAAGSFPALVVMRQDDFLTWETELEGEGWDTSRDILQIRKASDIDDASKRPWTFVSYDLVKNPKVMAWLLRRGFKTMICDEVHMIKRVSADRTKQVIALSRGIPYRIGLTGTPITNHLWDVFSECLFIDKGRVFGVNEWKFKARYYIKSGPGWYARRNSKDLVAQQLGRVGISTSADEVLKLPPTARVLKVVPMNGLQKRATKKLIEAWEYDLASGEPVELDYVIAQVQKLKQVANGFIYTPDGQTLWLGKHNNKIDLLFDHLTSEDRLAAKPKVVIWANFRAELRRVKQEAQRRKIKFAYFRGTHEEKRAARLKFKNDPTCRLFIAQADSGVGMNELVVADTAIYLSNSTRVVSRQQSERRIRRIGSEGHRKITYYDFISEDSIERAQRKARTAAMDLADYILAKLRQGHSVSRVLAA